MTTKRGPGRPRKVKTEGSGAIAIRDFPDMGLWLRFQALCLTERVAIGKGRLKKK
jgi:hypothetical protein